MENNSDPYPSQIPIFLSPDSVPGDILLSIMLVLIFIVLLALVTACETAFSSIKPSDIAQLKKRGKDQDEQLLKLLDKPASLQASLLISFTILLSIIVLLMSFLMSLLIPVADFFGSIILYAFLVSLALLFTGIFVPRIYAARHYMSLVKSSAIPVMMLNKILFPLSYVLIAFTQMLNRFIKRPYRFSEDDFNKLNDSILINEESAEERMILKGISNFGNIAVKQIMCSRVDIVAFDADTDLNTLYIKIREAGYSRIPIYEKNLDHIKGILFVKDLLIHMNDEEKFKWQNLIRPPYFVPENKKIDDLLREFQSRHKHIAIIVDEYGGTSGIVTLEDILEEIVGEINDEFDEVEDELRYSRLDENNFVFEGKTPLNDIYRLMNLPENPFDRVRGESDTIGGLILELAGKFLRINEKVRYENFLFTVESADRRRIKRVKITMLNEEPSASSGQAVKNGRNE